MLNKLAKTRKEFYSKGPQIEHDESSTKLRSRRKIQIIERGIGERDAGVSPPLHSSREDFPAPYEYIGIYQGSLLSPSLSFSAVEMGRLNGPY